MNKNTFFIFKLLSLIKKYNIDPRKLEEDYYD